MKYLICIFLACVAVLSAQVYWGEQPSNPFADGHLACLPMPPALAAPDPPLLPPPVIQRMNLVTSPETGKLEIYSPAAGTERMAETREADRTDWGILGTGREARSMVLASMGPIRVVKPIPVTPPAEFDGLDDNVIEAMLYGEAAAVETSGTTIADVQTSDAAPELAADIAALPASHGIPANVLTTPPPSIVPNLYLPEGATNEEGAQLTLIKSTLALHEQPDPHSAASTFVLHEGDRVRPLTRLRNEKDFDWIKVEWDGHVWWAEAEYFIRVDPRNHLTAQIRNIPIGEEAVDRDSALPIDYAPDDLTQLDRQYTLDTREHRVRKEVADAFARMADDAAKKGLRLKVFSGYRDFDHQKKLYLEAVAKNPKQNGVAAPGYSEHQLGTTVDVSNTDRHTVLSGRFGETPEGRWLHENAERFGFRNSYTNENTEQVGYKPEPWHLRYVGVRVMTERTVAQQ